MNKLKNKGFTLVELIVVITILAILGTIAFISINGLSADSRDSKRTMDLASISKVTSILLVKGVDVKSFVDGTGSTISWTGIGSNTNTGTRIRLSGIDGYNALANFYVGGDVNYKVLGIKKENFSDPLVPTTAYKIAATSYNGQYYQIAATLENGKNPKAVTLGTYSPRESTPIPGDIASGSTVFTLSGMLASESGLRVKDVIELSNIPYTIVKMDKSSIQVDTPASTGSVSILLHGDESAYIIKRWGTNVNSDNYKIDPDNGLKGSPYPLN